jgi:aryl-alcohol dehydrogenase-like predicted oxidoreductase
MARLTRSFSPLGYGAFKIGRNVGTKYGQAYELPDAAGVERLLNGVLDLGINYIDTAPAYGDSEERIGQAISHRRHEFVLSTKAGEFFESGVSRYDFSAAAARKTVEASLRRLRTEVLDLVFIHADRDDVRIVQQTEVVPTLVSLRDAGLVRGIGLSGHTVEGFRAALPWADAIMITYHRDDDTLAPVIDEAHRRGLAVIVKKGLASGRLPAAEALSFVLGNPAVTSVVVGSLSLDHLREDLRIAEQGRTDWRPGTKCDLSRARKEAVSRERRP